jgi:hypothetical protein
MQNKPAILAYPNSNNLGDFIQSIAAKQWIKSKKVEFLDRDQLHVYQGSPANLIMNGWFMEEPQNWPPSDKINPLFVSFHLNPTAEKKMLSPGGIAYFKKHEPIGCRDYYTQKILERQGIQTYFTGCLTLTLKRENFVKPEQKREGILVLSPLERLLPQEELIKKKGYKGQMLNGIQKLKRPFKLRNYKKAMRLLQAFLNQTEEEVSFTSQLIDPKIYSEAERIAAATQQLQKIACAKLVITSRIHTALPAVAFQTPVLFLSDGLTHINQKSRLEGMDAFFKLIRTSELKKHSFQLPEPKPVSKALLERFEKEITSFFRD